MQTHESEQSKYCWELQGKLMRAFMCSRVVNDELLENFE